MVNQHKIDRRGFTKVCYNHLCDNPIPENRYIRQSYQISRFWFCIPCLKSATPNALHYKCARKDCDNEVDTSGKNMLKYCSPLCRKRDSCGVGLLKTGICIVCNKEYKTRWICRQKYCSDSCRQTVLNVRFRMEQNPKYSPRSQKTRRIMVELVQPKS